jgi:acyl carrier protein
MINKIQSIIFDNIKKIKPSISDNILSGDSALFGSSSELDSLDLINLIVGIENDLSFNLNIQVTLANDEALSQEISPFTTVNTLVDYIQKLSKL